MEDISRKIKIGLRWQMSSSVIVQVMSFVLGIALARILTPAEFGLFGMAEVIMNFIFMFWNFGLHHALVQRKEINNEHLNVTFTISIIMGVFCYFLGFWAVIPVASYFQEPLIIPLGRIICLTFIIYSFDRVPTALLDRHFRFKERSLVNLINPIVYGAIAVPLALAGFGAYSFAWGVVGIAVGVTTCKILMSLYMFSWRPQFSTKWYEAKGLLIFGGAVTVANVGEFFIGNLQRIIPGRALGADAVGLLSRSSNLSTLLLRQVNTSVGSVLLPAFSKIQDDRVRINSWLCKLLFFTYSLLAPPMIFFIFFPEITIVGIFGINWNMAAPLLPWLAGATLFSSINVYFNSIIKSIGKPLVLLYINIGLVVLLTILLSVAVEVGLSAAAIAMCIFSCCRLIVNVWTLRFYGLLTFVVFVETFIEPVGVSFCSGIITLILVATFIQPDSIIIELIRNLAIYCSVFSCYLVYRYKRPYVSYLDFNLKDVIR